MTFWVPKLSKTEIADRQLLEDRQVRNDEYLADRERRALSGNETPEIIGPGDLDQVTQFSWDFSPGWKERKRKQIREKLNAGKALMPKVFVDHPTHLEPVYDTEIDLEPFAMGLACIRCRNPQPKDSAERKDKHRALARLTGYSVPEGLTVNDCCCYCGAILGHRSTVVA